MIKIRNGLFETNSSSGDVYDDYDYGPDLPDSFCAEIIIKIAFELKENIDKSIIEKDEEQILKAFTEAYNEYVKEIEKCVFKDFVAEYVEITIDDNNNIWFCYCDEYEFDVSHYMEGSYYPETRYSPAEYPYPVFELESDPPIWKEEWDEGLEHAILKSYCSKYISKFHKIELDDEEFDTEWDKLENYEC